MKKVRSPIKDAIFARFFEDEDLLDSIALTAKESHISSGFFFLIGTLKRAILGFYKSGKYVPIEKVGPLELVSCTGNISVKDAGEIVVHGHLVVADDKGSTFGGHLLPGCPVDATAELVLVQTESGTLRRKLDPERNLYLWSLGE